MSIDLQTQLNRVCRDIAVQRRLKRQKRDRQEDTAEIQSQLDYLRLEARIIKGRMEQKK